MPVLPDYAVTHQWLRELRRGRAGQRMLAVYFRVPDQEAVWVGRYNQPHDLIAASQAAAWVRDNPAGAQVVVPHSITPKCIDNIWALKQLVGWTEYPEKHPGPDTCPCPACLPPGLPKLGRRLNAMASQALLNFRRADEHNDRLDALIQLSDTLERASKGISPAPVIRLCNHPDQRIQCYAIQMLRHFPWNEVEDTYWKLLENSEPEVVKSAVSSLCSRRGHAAAAARLRQHQAALHQLDLIQYQIEILEEDDDTSDLQRALELLVTPLGQGALTLLARLSRDKSE